MRFVICFCLTLALAVAPALASDTKKDAQGLAHYITGVYYEDLGDLDKAVQEYKSALEADPQSTSLHLNLASVFIKQNDAEGAISQLKQAIALAPEAVEPHAILALVYAAQDKPELAAQEYTLALKNASRLEPKNIEIYKSLGAIYLQQKKLKDAESIFKLVAGLSPLDPQAHFFWLVFITIQKIFPLQKKN